MKRHNGIHRGKGVRRLGTITRVLIRHGFGDVADRIFSRSEDQLAEAGMRLAQKPAFPSPIRIRQVLEELGPSFIKLGQLMSVRADIFPAPYIEEFKKLQDSVPPVPFDAIRKVIETELGGAVEEMFTRFNPESLAVASVAQVHEATLRTGEKVAVKVIRPGIEKKIRDDIRVMYFFAERIEKAFEIGRVIGFVNLVGEFERTIFRELDMFTEAGNIEKFSANFAGSDEIYIADVFWEYVSKSVLVMEYIAGVKMDDVAAIREMGIDPKAVALIGLRSFSRQLMEFGFFHADPHPANTIVMPDGRVSLVDFGIIGYLDEEAMMQVANLFLGYAEHDYDMVMAALHDAGLIHDDIDLRAFRTDLKDVSEPFYGRSLQTIAVRDVYDQVMQLVLKYRIRLPRNLLLLFKTFIQTEALGKILGSDASLLEVTRPYARKVLQRGYDARKILRNLGRDARTFASHAKMFPGLVHAIFRRTAEGKHRMELRHTGFEPLMKRVEKGLNRAIVGGVISASTIAASLVLNSPEKVTEVSVAGHPVALTTLLGLSGYTIATVLGLWLILSIFRSGKM
ncbi:protein UbiB [Desulfonema ishimotonii]|uniref:Protein UbiB n=1 Tax=Desulfonema ishimotonii TaxID=45657 RepID=A0A401G302_9BACT|nr:AarF/UbiB family protein [Desulfonema ishimotonii]GBC63563.1 protein UbiB [Desulfonema ishimotonii]